MITVYTPSNWYWIVGSNTTQVYSSTAAVRNYVPVSDPVFVAWSADGSLPTKIDTEGNLGAVLAPYMLRPIPQGILDGYLDEQLKQVVTQPEFKIWLDVYKAVLHPTPDETQVTARIRGLL
jgi:hypothetical protein